MAFGKLFGAVHKAVKGVGKGVGKVLKPPGGGAKKSIGPSDDVVSKLSGKMGAGASKGMAAARKGAASRMMR